MAQTLPDINLGPGDTGPVLQDTLNNGNLPDGSPGGPMDLTGATVVFEYQDRGQTANPVTRPVTIVGDPTQGNVELDWMTTGGPVAPGDYDCRYVVTFADGHQVTVPDGTELTDTGQVADRFLWLHVGRAFVQVA
jgi:hypothetical protein